MSKAVGSAEIACRLVRCSPCRLRALCCCACRVAGRITERYLSSSFCSFWISSSFWSSSSSSSSISASRCRSSSIFSCSAYCKSRNVPMLPARPEPLPATFHWEPPGARPDFPAPPPARGPSAGPPRGPGAGSARGAPDPPAPGEAARRREAAGTRWRAGGGAEGGGGRAGRGERAEAVPPDGAGGSSGGRGGSPRRGPPPPRPRLAGGGRPESPAPGRQRLGGSPPRGGRSPLSPPLPLPPPYFSFSITGESGLSAPGGTAPAQPGCFSGDTGQAAVLERWGVRGSER